MGGKGPCGGFSGPRKRGRENGLQRGARGNEGEPAGGTGGGN